MKRTGLTSGTVNSLVCLLGITSFMQGNFFSLSSLEGGGTSRPLRGSRVRASRNRFSVGPFSREAGPCSSSTASESEWERVGGTWTGEDVRKECGDRGTASWGENTPRWLSLVSAPLLCRVLSSLCNCKRTEMLIYESVQSTVQLYPFVACHPPGCLNVWAEDQCTRTLASPQGGHRWMEMMEMRSYLSTNQQNQLHEYTFLCSLRVKVILKVSLRCWFAKCISPMLVTLKMCW